MHVRFYGIYGRKRSEGKAMLVKPFILGKCADGLKMVVLKAMYLTMIVAFSSLSGKV